jgi:hypothetical protein
MFYSINSKEATMIVKFAKSSNSLSPTITMLEIEKNLLVDNSSDSEFGTLSCIVVDK